MVKSTGTQKEPNAETRHQAEKACFREFTDMKELTPTIVNKLIQRIEFRKNEKKHSHNNVKVDIYFTAVGLVDIPPEQQLLEIIQKIKEENTPKSA